MLGARRAGWPLGPYPPFMASPSCHAGMPLRGNPPFYDQIQVEFVS
jgi:hypothetical protein